MRILMRNTVFKTAALAGLFSCVLALVGAFSGTTASVHATTASEVQTEADLKQFVTAAIDEYYIETIVKDCDFSKITVAGNPASALIDDNYPGFLDMPPDKIRPLIRLFPTFNLTRADMEEGCDFTHRFAEVFGRGEGDWKSGSIYLFIADKNGNVLFHGVDPDFEGERVVAVDEGGRNVRELILKEAETPMNAGIVNYCWDDPTVEVDNIDDNDPETAPGDSWKTSYVVDPFVDLEASALSAPPGVIFGSGIYPKTGTPPSGCNGNGVAGDGGEMEPDEPMEPEPMEPEPMAASVSGGGCAIAGSDSTPRDNAFNLLLTVSVLFLAVSFGNRAVDGRNDIRS